MGLKLTFDADANAAYLYFSSEKIIRTEEIRYDLNIDWDAQGCMVGMEFLDARKQIPSALLELADKP